MIDSSKDKLLIYGCYGYTGQLICEEAVEKGLRPIVAGRDAEKTAAVAQRFNLPFIVFDLLDIAVTEAALSNVKVVLNCAGPFARTARPMVNACLKTKTHYLDITGEYKVFEEIAGLDREAKMEGILLMPGVGFDVVPSDCLAVYLKDAIPSADTLNLALYLKGAKVSHGTAITITENLGNGGAVRRKGKIFRVKAGHSKKEISFGDDVKEGISIPWGDISTAYRSTRIPNITVYNIVNPSMRFGIKLSNAIGGILTLRPVQDYLKNRVKKGPAGPNFEQRERAVSYIWGEVINGLGIIRRAYLTLPDGYTLTALTSVRIASEVLNDNFKTGYLTPAMLFGKDFILQFEGVSRRDLN